MTMNLACCAAPCSLVDTRGTTGQGCKRRRRAPKRNVYYKLCRRKGDSEGSVDSFAREALVEAQPLKVFVEGRLHPNRRVCITGKETDTERQTHRHSERGRHTDIQTNDAPHMCKSRRKSKKME